MRQVFHKFLISEIPQKLKRYRNVWVGQIEFKKKLKKKQTKTKLKKQTPFLKFPTTVIWPAGSRREFQNSPANFRLGWAFSFLRCAAIILNKKFFLVFTLHWLDRSLDQAGPCGILSNRSDSPATGVVTSVSDIPTISRSAEGLQEKDDGQTVKQRKLYGKWPQKGQRALVSLWAVQVVQVF